MNFNIRLRNAIKASGLRVKEVAARANVSVRTIENWLEAEPSIPRVDYAVRVAKALDTTVEHLVDGSLPVNINYQEVQTGKNMSECICRYTQLLDILETLNERELDVLLELVALQYAARDASIESPLKRLSATGRA